MEAYHFWKLVDRECVAWVTDRIERRLLLEIFEIWFIRTRFKRAGTFEALVNQKGHARGDNWYETKWNSWWGILRDKLVSRYGWGKWYREMAGPAYNLVGGGLHTDTH